MLVYRDFRSCCNQSIQIYQRLSTAFAVVASGHLLADLGLVHLRLILRLVHQLHLGRYQQLYQTSEIYE